MKNKAIDVILSRVSCKSYSDKKVSANKIKQIAECGKILHQLETDKFVISQ